MDILDLPRAGSSPAGATLATEDDRPAILPENRAARTQSARPAQEDEGERDTLREPVTYHVPRSHCNRTCAARDEPVTYRVPRRRGGRPETGPAAAASPSIVPASVSSPVDPPPAPGPIEQAMCDLLANPASGITRVTVVGARPTSVATLEALAAQRGLQAMAAASPSLQRGWIRLACQTREPLSGEEDAPAAHGEPVVAGSRATPGGETFLRRICRQLRTAIAGLFA